MKGPHLRNPYAITVRLPWSHLIATGQMGLANRQWQAPTHVDQVLIHAAKTWDEDAHRILHEQNLNVDGAQLGAVVAVANLEHMCRSSRWTRTVVCDCGPLAQPGAFHWQLGQVWAMPNPIPIPGLYGTGVWGPSDRLVTAVRSQFRRLSRARV